jgi:hypothetical protein
MTNDLSYKELVPAEFDPSSRVWIYQSSRPFRFSEALDLEDMMNQFVEAWTSHGADVKGYSNLFFGQFIILMADETHAGVSGCSTDSSVRFIKEVERHFQVNLFDRQMLAFGIDGKVQMVPLSQIDYAIKNGFIHADTIYFNNIVGTKQELLDNWLIPVKDSWLAKRYPALQSLV